MSNKTVSIIMPAHNAAKTIRESIESVLAQTFTDWELLVINDTSTDETEQIVSEFTTNHSRIKLLQTDESVGKPYYPRNVGINSAEGRFIAFLDSDDVWLPTKLAKQIPLFDAENVAIVFSYYEKFTSTEVESNRNRILKSPASVSFKSALYGNPIGNLTGVYDTMKVGKIFYEDAVLESGENRHLRVRTISWTSA